MRSHWRISSLVLGSVGVSMLITRSAGAPILTMASRIRSTIILLVSLARGCGATMIELRPLTALIALMNGVASGLVVGDNAPITPIRSEEHTSELQSLMRTSYAVFSLKKKTQQQLTKIIDEEQPYQM